MVSSHPPAQQILYINQGSPRDRRHCRTQICETSLNSAPLMINRRWWLRVAARPPFVFTNWYRTFTGFCWLHSGFGFSRRRSQHISWNGAMALRRKVRMHQFTGTCFKIVRIGRINATGRHWNWSNYSFTESFLGATQIKTHKKAVVTMAQYFNQQPQGSKNRIENVAIVGVRDIMFKS